MAYDPELMDALLGIVQGQDGTSSTVSDQNATLQDALTRARALKDAPPTQHSSALGGLFGGIGQMVGAGAGAYQEKQALGGLKDLHSQNAGIMRQAGPAMFPGATQDPSDDEIAQLLSQYGAQQGM